MKLKIKKLSENAVIPQYAKPGDAGLDLTATSIEYVGVRKVVYGTGLAFEIPEGHVGLIFPRSSIHKKMQRLSNCVGVIDSGYRGEVKFVFDTHNLAGDEYAVGDRIGQMIVMPFPQMEIEEIEELSETERGETGFGSSGK